MVAPLSALPVFILLILWLLPYLIKGGQLPVEVKPLVIFLLAAVAVSAGALFLPIPTFKSATPLGQELRAFITLAIGGSFYILFAAWPRDTERLRKTLRWITIGGVIMLLWGFNQIAAILVHATQMPRWYSTIQHLLVTEGAFYIQWGRMNGFSVEPSWFTHLLIMLYLPLWLASSYTRKSLFKIHVGKLIVEDFILAVGLVEFMLAAPRISFVGLALMAVFLAVRLNVALVRGLVTLLSKRLKLTELSKRQKTLLTVGIGLGLFAVYGLLAGGVGFWMVQRDWRLAKIFENTPTLAEIGGVLILDESSWLQVGLRLVFFERVIYWMTGLRIFGLYPWFGVGLGNAGFFFQSQVPPVSYESPELRDLLFRATSLPNTKNLWVRLMSETGLTGFALFVFWLYTLWQSAHQLARRSVVLGSPALQVTALLGQLALIALIAEGFSLDSFAMPYLWVTAGLISAAARIGRQEMQPVNHA